MNRELMIHVERIVRPLRAYPVKKMQIRDELYGLLLDIYEQELSRSSDEEVAVAAAIARFGPAESLQAELRDSLTRLDELAWLEDWMFRRRAGQRAPGHAARVGGIVLLYSFVCLLPLLVSFRLAGGVPDGERVGLAIVSAIGSFAFVATLLVHATAWCFTRNRWTKQTVTALALSIAGSGALVLLLGFGVMWLGSLNLDAAFRGLPWWAPTALGAMLTVPVLAGLVVRRDRREEPWRVLVID